MAVMCMTKSGFYAAGVFFQALFLKKSEIIYLLKESVLLILLIQFIHAIVYAFLYLVEHVGFLHVNDLFLHLRRILYFLDS